jgi:hypothetical protein
MTVALLILTLWGVGDARAASPKPTLKSVGDQVYCVCGGCVALLNHCPHLPSECSTRAQMEELIQKGIARGKDEKGIIQDLVLRYGVQVQATPPAKGFNLTVWILPGVGLISGLVVVLAMVRRWRRVSARPQKAPAARIDPKLVAAVEQEIKKIVG